ncbi:MAG: choice-of-anchor J domain-containing protein [Bacteroidales bacterium]|nr:choice-of-anchor J domain-containing protein [Bacteroidales bacterium]
MKKGIFSLMMGLILAFTGLANAQTIVEVGTGTSTTSAGAFNSVWGYTFAETLYPASEIGMAGTITHLAYHINSTASYHNEVVIYMKNVSRTTFASVSDVETVTPADIVYQGDFDFPSTSGWFGIDLDTPFEYDGTSTLMIAFDENASGYSSRDFYYTNVSNCRVSFFSDSTNPDPYNLGSFTGSSSTGSYMSNIQLTITSGGAAPVVLTLDPDPVDFGARPNNCWMRPMVVTVTNEGPATQIFGVDVDNNYFVPSLDEEMAIPFALGHGESFNVNFGWTTAAEGEVNGVLAIDNQNRLANLFDITAYAYEPVEPDVWEMARVVSNPEDYRDTPTTVTLYNNYLLPPTDVEDGIDAVYKVTFDHDVMLNGNVVTVGGTDKAENGKMAVYTQAGIDEVGGPDLDNNYTGPTVSSSEPMEMTAYPEGLDGTTTVGTLPMYGLYADAYTRSQYVIPATEIAQMAGCPINSLTYYTASTPTPWQSNFQVYLTEVNYTTVSSLIDPATATTVYTGQLVVADGMMHIDFATPYQYNGGNLLIGMDCLECNNYSSCYFKAVSMTGAGMYAYNYSAPTFTSPYTVNYAPTTTFGYMGRNANRAEEVVYSQEFNSTPSDWTLTGDWHVASYGEGSYFHPDATTAPFLLIDSDGNGSGTYGTATSPVINLDGYTSAILDLDQQCVTYGDDLCTIEVYDGTQWVEVANYTSSVGDSYSMENTTIDVTAYANANFQVRFHYDDNGGWNYGWVIDNFQVLGEAGTPGPGPTPVPGDQLITNMTMLPGTYYIAASSTADAWDVILNASELPCPDEITAEANCVEPADDADGIDPSSVTLKWHLSPYTTEYRLVFGSTYYCENVLVDWTRDLAESYTVRSLFNNTNYFWRIEERNDGCPQGVQGPVWGFTTTFNAPTNLHSTNANGNMIYEGETLSLAWNPIVDRTFRSYNVYMDGELIGQTPSNPDPTATTTFDVEGLTYEMGGHIFWVTAYYDEGESGPSNELVINISGNSRVAGHVYEQDGETGIAGAIVTFNGTDEFGRTRSYDFITDATGTYGGDLLAGNYNGKAECNGYQTVNAPVCGNPVEFTYAQTTEPVDFVMDEVFAPVAEVIAEYYPDPEDPESPYVKVYWGWNIMSAMIEDFETGDFSQYEWNIPAQYPFEITTNNPYEGTYCMQSTNYNVASSTSSIDVNVEIPRDGLMSFYKRISCESSWDMAYFYMDGVQMATFTGTSGWGVKEVSVTEGTHNFKWAYTKDSSVDSGEDRFFIDYIDFIHDAQPVGAGWHTYLEGEFDNAYVSNVGTPSWGYEYPASVISSYAGMNMTKVALFSDDMYGAVGGTFTCNVYQGGATPAAGTLVSTITVDVPANVGDWVEFDLTTPVHVTNDPLYVLWTADVIGGLGYPAGCATHTSAYGDWWNNGQDGWEHMGDCTWTMKNYFSDRSGRGFWASSAETNQAIQPMGNLDSKLRTYAKGEEVNNGAACINPNATFKATANASDRSFQYFRVYRTDCYNDGPYTEENTVVCCCELHDTLYIDVEWPELAPGVYKWGVGCVYGGNRESEITWANVNVPQAYDRDAVKLAAEQNHAEISCKEYVNAEGTRAPWDLMGSMSAYEAAQYGVATDGNNIYTCNWGYASATYNFCKYDMQGNFIEGFNIAGCGTIRDLDYDGQYFYGGANGSTLYCMDLANHTLVSTISTGCSAIRHCSYDPQNDGFWVGGWSDLMLINRNGQVVTTAPAPSSCGGTGYYEDENGNGHVYLWCEPQSVYDYDIAANSINYINNFTNIPGWDGSSTAGGAFVGEYNGKVAFFCNIQQDPNIIGIFELRDAGTPGPDPQGDPIQEPRESPIVWSNCLDKDMYLNGAVDITVLLNSADSPEGVNVSFTNLNEGEQELYPVAPVTLDGTGYYAWDTFRRGDYVVNVTMGDAYEPITDTVSIWDATSLRYVMIEIIYGVNDLYVSQTGWAMWSGHGQVGPNPGPQGGGDTFEFGFDSGLDGWTNIDADGDGEVWYHSTQCESMHSVLAITSHSGAGHLCSESYCNATWMALNPNNFLVSPQMYNIANGSTLSFWACAQDASYAAEHFGVAISTTGNTSAADFTTIQEWTLTAKDGAKANPAATRNGEGNREGNWYQYTCDLSAYAGQQVWIAIRHFNVSDMFLMCLDDMTLTNGAKSDERHLEGYKVLCTSIDGEPIFSGNTEHNFIQLPVDELVEGDHYVCKVAAIYSTGMSAWSEAEWMYRSCENYAEAQNVGAEGQTVTWEYPGTPGPVPPTPGEGDEFSFSFDSNADGWTTINADGDDHNWYHSSQADAHSTLAITSHTGAGHMMSESYCNATWAALHPDEYLVAPQMYNIAAGSTFSFWACAQDASYAAEHFGVAISTTGNTNAADFTTIQEWTLTAKGGAKATPAATRDGEGTREGNWYQYTCDLSAYAGQQVWIAIRHFGCTDMFIMCMDDAQLTAGAKSNRDVIVFNGYVTDPGAMANGADASWIKGSQSTWGPNVNNGGGYMLGDSFTLSAATTISEIEVYGYQTGSTTTSTFTGLYAQIYNGNPMNGATAVWGDMTSNIMTATAFTNCYRGSDGETTATTRPIMSITASNLNIQLEAGTYYLVYSLAGTGSSGPWGAPHAEPVIGNTGNGIQYTTEWVNLTDSGDGTSYGCAMKITGDGGAPVPPTPTGDVLGAMIFRDGEWLAEVAYPTSEYTDEEAYGEHEYCVRIIYNGTAQLPENNVYYSMSCPVCVGGEATCAPGADIYGEYVWNNANDFGALITWGGSAPVPPTPGEGDEFTEGFESGSIPTGWTTIDADGDGHNWSPASVLMAGYLIPAHGGADCFTSESYSSTYGALTPDNYLVSPQVTITNGSQFSFWACAQDPSYAGEHYGVAISTTGNTNAADFTTIAEWTMTAKDAAEAGAYMSKNGKGTREGTWYQKTVDLSDYAGQEVYIAIRHFNCTDMFYLNVDDAELSIGAKGNRAGIVKYNVYRSADNANYELIGSVDAVAGQEEYSYYDATAAGAYYYQVRADYGDCESEPALSGENPANNYVIVNVTSVAENGEVALYPNPTNGNITIQAQNMNRITVVSVLGQVVYDVEVEGDSQIINMAQFNAGVYMVRIATENGVSTQRVTVVK